MGRRGDVTVMNVVVGLILVFAVLVLMLLFLNRSSRSFLDSLTCDEEGDSGLIQMPKHEGCLKSNQHASYMLGFFGVDKGYVCCEITDYNPKDSATWDLDLRRTPPGDTPTNGVAVQGLTMTSALTNKALADGATVAVYASSSKTPNTVTMSGAISCPAKEGCPAITCVETLTTVTGKDVVKELLTKRACPGGKIAFGSGTSTAKSLAGTLEIKPDPAYADQTLLYTLRILKDGLELDTYTLKFRITSPVKYAGLSPTWSRRKEVTAACESPVACSDILFRTVEKPAPGIASSCPLDVEPSSAKEIKTTYCVVKDGQLTDTCGASLNACTQALLSLNDVEYSGLHTALLTAVERGIIQDSFALQFANAQGAKSTYSCIKNTGTITGSGVTADNGAALYRVPVDPTTGRAMFTLEHKSFEGKYLCLYGRDKTDPNTVYAAKGPVKLALDVTPPTAHLEFKPGSLQLRFGCTDQPDGGSADPDLVSGCKDTFGTAYISQTAPFLTALVSQNTPQNAAAWCPPYTNAGAYRTEYQSITQPTISGTQSQGCVNECSPTSRRCFSAVSEQYCGNYDSDTCSDWSPAQKCPSGQCANGACVGSSSAAEGRQMTTKYTGNEIRVLCLRVEDNAGNAGVAMTTVYNTYDLLLNALAGAVNEGR